ncbi:MAG: repeat containing protein [Cyanobacteria bacterium RYN_339]|nr:repeat containing protein [Cyanobacteria bacterium RYN_339]
MAKRGTTLHLIHALVLSSALLTACQGKTNRPATLLTTASVTGIAPTRIDNAPPAGTKASPANQPPVPVNSGDNTPTPAVPPLVTQPQTGLISPNGAGATGGSGGSGGNSGSGSTSIPLLSGFVGLPASIISNNGSAIISNNGSAIISNNGSAIISNNGSAIISNNGSAYHLTSASGPEGFLNNAFMYLTDRDERFFFNTGTNLPFTTTTDGGGRYTFPIVNTPGFPIGKDTIVNASVNGNLRFTGYMKPTLSQQTLKLNVASTLVTEFLRGEAYRVGKSLSDYDVTQYLSAINQTDTAITSGDIAAITTVNDQTNTPVTVGVFDFRIDHIPDLRNQYVIAISRIAANNTVVKQISDTWKGLIGTRPAAVTSELGGKEAFPSVGLSFATFGFLSNEDVNTPNNQRKLGFNYGVCTSKGGDIFVTGYTQDANTGHVRWIHPDGRVTALWTPTYAIGAPVGICMENDAPNGQTLDGVMNAAIADYNLGAPLGLQPGTLLVSDVKYNTVIRIPIIDQAVGDIPNFIEAFRMSAVAGDSNKDGPGGIAQFYPDMYADHPDIVETPVAATDGTDGAHSNWRYAEEGDRKYLTGDGTHAAGSSVPNAARFARLDNPNDVKVDKYGSIYICDQFNHRVRFIPSAAALAVKPIWWGYRDPVVDAQGYVTSFKTTALTAPMKAQCMYTIAGNPRWVPANTMQQTSSHWFGEYEITPGVTGDSVPAEQTHLDQPYAMALHDEAGDVALYVAELDNNRVRRIDPSGTISTFAGNPPGSQVSNGQGDFDYANATGDGNDGGPATAAQLSRPRGLVFDVQGRLYINDSDSGRVRMVATNGTITTVAGRLHGALSNATDNKTDGDALRWCDLYSTEKLTVDPAGNILFMDFQHKRLRKLWRQWE